MDTANLGRWAFIIALVIGVLGGLLSAFGMDFLSSSVVVGIAALLALLGGIFYLANGDRTEYLIAAIALGAFAAGAGELFGLGSYVGAILAGAAAAAAAGAAGVLLVMVYEWIMP